MSPESIETWRSRGRQIFDFVRTSERQLSSSLHVSDVTVLAAADQLAAATKVALAWLTANPCPDSRIGVQAARMLNNCAEVARTAQRVAADPTSDTQAARSRLENLAVVIRVGIQTLDRW